MKKFNRLLLLIIGLVFILGLLFLLIFSLQKFNQSDENLPQKLLKRQKSLFRKKARLVFQIVLIVKCQVSKQMAVILSDLLKCQTMESSFRYIQNLSIIFQKLIAGIIMVHLLQRGDIRKINLALQIKLRSESRLYLQTYIAMYFAIKLSE